MEFIDNQPWIFTPRNEYQLCKNEDERCNIVQPGDKICVQVGNPPCLDTTNEFVCDNEFAVFNSGTQVENGVFDGSDDDWNVGAHWSYVNGVEHVDTPPDSTSALSQTIAAGLVEDGCYVLKFTVLNYVSGSLTPTLGTVNGATVSADGEYSMLIQTDADDNDLYFTPAVSTELDIDNVQLYYLGDCWCADNGNLTPFGTTGACHVPGQATVLTQVTPPLTNGAFYKVYISVRNRTQGTVKCTLGFTDTVAFDTNGDHIDYVASTGTDFTITMDADFDGCVTYVGVVEYNRDNGFFLVDEDDVEVFDFSGQVIYHEDRAFFCFDMSVIRDDADQPFPYGCYRVKLVDSCTNTEHFSNCMSYAEEWPDTRVISACDWMDGDDSDFRYSFGLLWIIDLFTLQQRVDVHFRKSSSSSRSDSDRFSTGRQYRSYVERNKKWDMVVEELDETQLDCLDVQTLTRDWKVDEVAYFREDEEFAPNWDDPGLLSLADVKLTVSRRDGVIFSDNCSR